MVRALLLSLLLVACSAQAPAGAPQAAAPPDTTAEYCDLTLRLEMIGTPETGQPMQDFVRGEVLPLVTDLAAIAPAEVAEDVEGLRALVDGVAASGDTAVFTSLEFQQRNARMHTFELDRCGWARTDVRTIDYAVEGVPEVLEPGPRSFELDNQGTQPHELAILRKEGETLTFLTSAFAAPGANAHGYAVVDLTPGDYQAVCLIHRRMGQDFRVQ